MMLLRRWQAVQNVFLRSCLLWNSRTIPAMWPWILIQFFSIMCCAGVELMVCCYGSCVWVSVGDLPTSQHLAPSTGKQSAKFDNRIVCFPRYALTAFETRNHYYTFSIFCGEDLYQTRYKLEITGVRCVKEIFEVSCRWCAGSLQSGWCWSRRWILHIQGIELVPGCSIVGHVEWSHYWINLRKGNLLSYPRYWRQLTICQVLVGFFSSNKALGSPRCMGNWGENHLGCCIVGCVGITNSSIFRLGVIGMVLQIDCMDNSSWRRHGHLEQAQMISGLHRTSHSNWLGRYRLCFSEL